MQSNLIQGSNVISVIPGMVPFVDERAFGVSCFMVVVNLLRCGCPSVQVLVHNETLFRRAILLVDSKGGKTLGVNRIDELITAWEYTDDQGKEKKEVMFLLVVSQ